MNPALRLQILLFTFIRIIFNTMLRMVYPYLNEFSRGMGVDLLAISRALTLRAVLGSFAPLLAFFAEGRGRKAGMFFGLVLMLLGPVVLVFSQTFTAFVVAMAFETVGYHVFVPVMQAYLGDNVPYRQRGMALAVTEFSWSLSFIFGVPLAGLLIKRLGWSSPYSIIAILGLMGILILFRLMPADAPQGGPDRGVLDSMLFSLKLVFMSSTALSGLSVSVLMVTANEIVNLVFGVWMGDSFDMQITALGAVAIGIGLAEFGGEALVGLADRFGKLRAVGLGLALNTLAALGLLFVSSNQAAAVVILFAFYLTFEFTLVGYLPVMTEVLPAARASMMAVNIAFFGLGRAIGAPLGAWLYTLAQGNLPAIAPNALMAVALNLAALGALYLLLKLWRPAEGVS